MINYSIGGRMLKRIQIYLLVIFLAFSACTTKKKIVEDEFATEEQATDSLALDAGSDDSMSDDLSLDESGSSSDQAIQAAESSAATDANTDELSLESELQAASDESKNLSPQANSSDDLSIDTKPAPTDSPVDEMSSAEPIAPSEVAKTEVAPPEPVPVQVEATTTPVAEQPSTPAPLVSESPTSPAPDVQPTVQMAQVSEVQFKSNDSGGALIIQADQPLEYTTRLNTTNNQVIIEVLNVKVPSKLKRPLATKDMSSSIGHIDIYQKEKASTARFVIQLRPNSDQPLIQPEGTSLMVIGALVSGAAQAQKNGSSTTEMTEQLASGASSTDAEVSAKTESDISTTANSDVNMDLSNENLLNTTDMDEYLANNTKFYGKKISIETTDMDVRDVLKFIAEESGVNMLFDDNINGTISLKLRKVPWDQAFVLVLKSKGLSYRRQGSVLRVASADRLVAEEKSAILLKESKTAVEPLVVKNFSINYADITELEKKLIDYIASDSRDVRSKGRITSDKRTNTMIVTETATKLKQVEELIRALDTQPQQVMIEARVIEASETFGKSLGVNWGLNRGTAFSSSPRVSTNIGQPWSDPQPIKISPSVGYTSPQSTSGSFQTSLWFGKLGALGDLDVQLALQETEDKVKILSTPRVTVLTNTQATINQSFKLAQGTKTTTSNGVPITETNFVDVGVKLNVTPQISNLGTVRMVIDVARTGLQPGGSTNARDMKTEVIVKSGDTTVIGGVFQSDVVVQKNGIPGLKDIPILGTLFRGQNDSQTKTELMVFVTPKILSPITVNGLSSSGSVDSLKATEVK